MLLSSSLNRLIAGTLPAARRSGSWATTCLATKRYPVFIGRFFDRFRPHPDRRNLHVHAGALLADGERIGPRLDFVRPIIGQHARLDEPVQYQLATPGCDVVGIATPVLL